MGLGVDRRRDPVDRRLTVLLDTHFILWIAAHSHRLKSYRWLERYRPWTVSPVSFLEIQFLVEVGRVEVSVDELTRLASSDPRFLVDEVPLKALIDQAMRLGWTRDPFDRLLAGHSLARQLPFCSVDSTIQAHHPRLPPELTQ